MKPSERIKEIEQEVAIGNFTDKFGAIIQYLDEEYESEQVGRKELKEKLVPMD